MQYKKGTSPVDFERELNEVERAFNEQDFVQLTIRYREPERYREGMVVYADGTEWNPGSGKGVYVRKTSSWVLLG